jgi:hypothetical protein
VIPADEYLIGSLVGWARQAAALILGKRDQAVAADADDAYRWEVHRSGCVAEMVACRDLDRYWAPTIGKTGGPDLLNGWMVRQATGRGGPLILRKGKDENHRGVPWILVCDHRTVGYMIGAEAMTPGYWSDPGDRGRPCWSIPQSRLHPISELIR